MLVLDGRDVRPFGRKGHLLSGERPADEDMAAYVIDSRIFRDQFATPEMREIFSDENTIQRWIDVEVALARVQADLGIIPDAAASEIERKGRVEFLNLDELKDEINRTSHPVVPLLKLLERICTDGAGEFLHWGATTQDIVDTGTVLQIRDALGLIAARQASLRDDLLRLARCHRNTVMVGRTHGQQALPLTFGFKVAVWVAEIDRNHQRLAEVRQRVLMGQFSGAVGTLAALPERGIAVQEQLMKRLGLASPVISWHSSRDGIAELMAILAICISTVGKIANEIYHLQRTEIAELEEPFPKGKIGSSTMPHKRNPPVCEAIVALARTMRSIVPLALEGMMAEHERDKIGLQVEREFISRAFCVVDAAMQKMLYVIRDLTVRPDRMEANLHILGGSLMSEAIMMRFGETIGRQRAHEIVHEISMRAFEQHVNLKDALLANSEVCAALTVDEIECLLDPHRYTGLSGFFVDRVVGEATAGGM